MIWYSTKFCFDRSEKIDCQVIGKAESGLTDELPSMSREQVLLYSSSSSAA